MKNPSRSNGRSKSLDSNGSKSSVKSHKNERKQAFPDIAYSGRPTVSGGLAQVGMSDIEVPIRFPQKKGPEFFLAARADAYVSLDKPDVKGIHMSRLFVALQKEFEENAFSLKACERILESFLKSHEEISESAFLNLRFDLPIKRKALLSNNEGWRYYPVEVRLRLKDGKVKTGIKLTVTYSSTCPCSAALARQLIQAKFEKDFAISKKLDMENVVAWLGSEQGIIATPHGQRSHGKVQILLRDSSKEFSFTDLVDSLEKSLGTPVQTAVKREDEQEFARLNGQNLMFAEDAARKMDHALRSNNAIAAFRAQAVHYESLHPHDAVAMSEWNADELV